MVINPIVGVYLPIIRIPIKGGMTIPKQTRVLTMAQYVAGLSFQGFHRMGSRLARWLLSGGSKLRLGPGPGERWVFSDVTIGACKIPVLQNSGAIPAKTQLFVANTVRFLAINGYGIFFPANGPANDGWSTTCPLQPNIITLRNQCF